MERIQESLSFHEIKKLKEFLLREHMLTILDTSTEDGHATGREAVAGLQLNFSFAIVVGEEPYAESAGDYSEIINPFDGSELVSSVADHRTPTLAILISGRALVIEPWFLEKVDGLIVAWLPGTEGRGITDVSFGD
ncbi:hypothetical protein CRYUN_Cryun25bG0096200 [Craigia yunnanensis]